MIRHSPAMARPHFITPAMSILLDAVRAIAALLVLGGHAVQMGIYTGPYPFGSTTQHYAVIVFFVLSGLVIAHSVRGGRYTLRDYAIARAARIAPVAAFAVLFGSVIFYLLTSRGLWPQPTAPVPDRLTVQSVVMPLLFLSERGDGISPVWNPPYWSLSYEVWFYILFGAAAFLRGTRRVFWVALLAWIAGWRILLMMPIWLIGAALVSHGTRWQPRGPQAIALALFGLILLSLSRLWAYDVQTAMAEWHAGFGYHARMSEYFVTDFIFGLGVAVLFISARPFAERFSKAFRRFEAPIRWAAGFSFSLYILHWPMLSALSALGIGAGQSPLAFLALAGGIIGACALIAQFTEYRSRDVRHWLAGHIFSASAKPRAAA
jgi:peptidoglycan/LPS O-acetylase OafA/YrhL